MSMETAIYVSMGIVILWAFAMVAWAVWSKKQENPEFSFLRHVRNLKLTRVQYEQFASSGRLMMYSYAFMGGVAWGKGNISMAITSVSMFVGMQLVLFWVRAERVSKWPTDLHNGGRNV